MPLTSQIHHESTSTSGLLDRPLSLWSSFGGGGGGDDAGANCPQQTAKCARGHNWIPLGILLFVLIDATSFLMILELLSCLQLILAAGLSSNAIITIIDIIFQFNNHIFSHTQTTSARAREPFNWGACRRQKSGSRRPVAAALAVSLFVFVCNLPATKHENRTIIGRQNYYCDYYYS